MDKNKLYENMLKADGIDPAGPNNVEWTAFNQILDKHLKVQKSGDSKNSSPGMFARYPFLRYAAAILIIVGILTGIYQITGSLDGATVAWADVVERFNSIRFFNASIYMKEDATDEPIQFELWRNSQKKSRLRVDGQVLFGDGNQVVAGYSIESPVRKIEPLEYNDMGMQMIQRLFNFEEFSLDTVIAAFGVSKDQLTETTPLINPAAMISEDLLVFDIHSDISPEWMRIWVLRESKLPIRIRSWDPRDGECVDAVITYSTEQSPEFFDPDAYEKVLLDVEQGGAAGGRANLAYALLNDPGGQDYTPKDLFETAKAQNAAKGTEADPDDISGYHLPVVEDAGVTEYGAVWIVASQAQNRKPDGQMFYGFSDISDDLNRDYDSAYSMHISMNDVSVNVFVPDGYPLDNRQPKALTLRCATEAIGAYQKEVLIGNVQLDSWKENTLWPTERLNKTELWMITRHAWTKTGNRQACEAIINLIQELDTNHEYDHEIEKMKLRMLIKENKYQEAAVLADKILDAEFEAFKAARHNASYYDFYDYIVAIAGNGDIQRATDLFNQIKQLEPNLSAYANNQNATKHFRERLQRQLSGHDLYNLIQPLFEAGLDLPQVNTIIGFDVLENEETKWYVPDRYRRQRDPRVIKQETYKEKLTEKYTANPLEPGQMVLNPCKLKEVTYAGRIPEVEHHYFYVFNRELHKFLKGYKARGQEGRANRIRIDDSVENPMMQHEIIYYSEKDFLWDECKEFVMSEFGLEAVEGVATETVLIAEYDGSERKDYRDVRCPALRGSTSTPGMMYIRSGSGIWLCSALDSLARDQEVLVVNDTGLDDQTIITQELPNFKTAKGMELAEQWYKENFGITFRKEQRQLPIWTIRKKP